MRHHPLSRHFVCLCVCVCVCVCVVLYNVCMDECACVFIEKRGMRSGQLRMLMFCCC